MKFYNNPKLDRDCLYNILQDCYDIVPRLMNIITPEGWENGYTHQELLTHRQELYGTFLDDIEPEDYLSFDDYFSCSFPPEHNSQLELFYLLGVILTEITCASTIYRPGEPEAYYFDPQDMQDMMLKTAAQRRQLDMDCHRDCYSLLPPCPEPLLEEMDLHHCIEALFTILRSYGFKLDYWDMELLEIAELQDAHNEVFYSCLDPEEKETKQMELKQQIIAIMDGYTTAVEDPFDLPAIVKLFNQRKVCPIVLAYLHSYDEFPKGYPYRLGDYCE